LGAESEALNCLSAHWVHTEAATNTAIQWRRNEFESGGTRPVWSAVQICYRALHFLALKYN